MHALSVLLRARLILIHPVYFLTRVARWFMVKGSNVSIYFLGVSTLTSHCRHTDITQDCYESVNPVSPTLPYFLCLQRANRPREISTRATRKNNVWRRLLFSFVTFGCCGWLRWFFFYKSWISLTFWAVEKCAAGRRGMQTLPWGLQTVLHFWINSATSFSLEHSRKAYSHENAYQNIGVCGLSSSPSTLI